MPTDTAPTPHETVSLVFETHATSEDNEARRASGWHDSVLSSLGERQAAELGERRQHDRFAAIYCSDFARASRTVELAFAARTIPIYRDASLRECNYGELNRAPLAQVESEKLRRITTPFPGGESYEEAVARMRPLLCELMSRHAGECVLIVGHRATQHGLEHWLCGRPLEVLVAEPFRWQPGWRYQVGLPFLRKCGSEQSR